MTKKAFDKYNVIKPYLEQHSSLLSIAGKNNISLRTLQRWRVKYNRPLA